MWPFSSSGYRIYTPKELDKRTFDYIVVGGGTAGCVVASRLSENPEYTVLLIERGPIVDSWLSRVPLLSVDFRSSWSPTYQWKSAANAVSDEVTAANMVSGKALGGTSKVNSHVYTRSVPGEYNGWTEEGHRGWNWSEVEPRFRKSETSLTHAIASHRGSQGPWRNQRLPEVHFRVTTELLNAAEARGIPYQEDMHDPAVPPYSCGLLDVTIDENGRRHSTFDAFLSPDIRTRRASNLFVCPDAVVAGLDIKQDQAGPRATGVFLEPATPSEDYPWKGASFYASARREIILSAGAIATPQIMMLSGIGPRSHLEAMGIPVIKDLPGVGSKLQDHPCVPLIYKVPRVDSLHEIEKNRFLAIWEVLRYVLTGRGMLLSPNPQMAIFALSKLLDEQSRTVASSASDTNSHLPANIPDIELTAIPYNVFDDSELAKDEGVSTVACILLKPRSSGTVRLASLDPRERPICDLNFLEDKHDYEVFRKALRLGLALGRQCREQGYPLRDMVLPDSESDEDLDRYIRQRIRTTFHYSSTCRMASEEEMGVVDDELRVHGVQSLRIADTSIFPSIPAAHPQAPVVMIAERCAEFVIAARR